MASEPIPFVGYVDLEEESLIETLKHKLRIQQHEIDRLNDLMLQHQETITELKSLVTSRVEREGDVAVWYLEREA
jgi:hypothetical protein